MPHHGFGCRRRATTGHNVQEQDPALLADTILKFLGA
jgi:hypothetical protein